MRYFSRNISYVKGDRAEWIKRPKKEMGMAYAIVIGVVAGVSTSVGFYGLF